MPSAQMVADVRFVRALDADARHGLLGYISCTLERVRIDGLTLRRTASGDLCLSFPSRTDAHGRRHPIVRPLDDEARWDIERQVLAALDLGTVGDPEALA